MITVLFADLVGFTSRAEQMDVEDVRAMLAPYYALVRQQLEQRGGTVEKFIGDAIMAVFGAPSAHEDDPERAVRSALAIREALAQSNARHPELDLHVRVAVNTVRRSSRSTPTRQQARASHPAMSSTPRHVSRAPHRSTA